MSKMRVCDHCKASIPEGEGLSYQESIFVREAKDTNAHADSETVLYDVHEECAAAFGGERRADFLARFKSGADAVAKAGEPKPEPPKPEPRPA